MSKRKRVQVTISENLDEWFTLTAKDIGTTKSSLMAMALSLWKAQEVSKRNKSLGGIK